MILGANTETRPLVDVARSLGVITWVVDPDPDANAKKSSNYSLDVDGLDIESIVVAARQANIDGVLVGVADSLVASYQKVCEILKVPCYASAKAVAAFSSKDGFIENCLIHGVPTTPTYSIDAALAKESVELVFPVLVKPVDRASGIGISICHDRSSLLQGIEVARSLSISKRVLIEKYMKCEDLIVYYTFVDGVAYLSAYGDRITSRKQLRGSPVCIGIVYPGNFLDKFEKSIHPKLLEMFRALQIENGVLAIQFFHDNGNFYAYDPGFRLQGEGTHIHLLKANGIDQMEMLVNFALTGKMTESDFGSLNDVRLNNHHACTVWILIGKGRISHIEGLSLLNGLASYKTQIQRLFVNDLVVDEMIGTERQVFARIYLQHKDLAQLQSDIQAIHRQINVIDQDGISIIVDGLFRPNNFKLDIH
jgi:biotin carboxylase